MPAPTPQSLATLLSGITSRQGWQPQLNNHRLFLHWDRLVDVATSAHARPIKIVRGILWIEVANSAWMQHLQFQKVQLLEAINGSQHFSRLTDIRFTLAIENKAEPSAPKATVCFVQPPLAAREAFQQQISDIKDEKIREALMGLWYQFNSCQKS